MKKSHLHLFPETSPLDCPEGVRNQEAGSSIEKMVPIGVRDLASLLVDAFQSDRTWLRDFESEQIFVSTDLYEILLAYQQVRRCDAA